ncbi:Fanconi anemia group J protein [Strongyloides ratti]|uniref:Fanconi anemia group J protein n=1 Tax=Strongyloides ratti TaxID=34506 RepID=A0A090LKU9_STRRB|nr:Fanconi anemia group J protein [Strongyloides ratti]CEF68783.1 Fanconi anemia group J protein [Strongyloides ratti]
MPKNKFGREVDQKSITLFAESDKKRAKKRAKISIRVEAEKCQSIVMHNRKIQFPGNLTPYGSQMMIIHKNIYSFDRGLNVLLESPTGSGKTIALLSSALAWLHDYDTKRELSMKSCPKHSKKKKEQDKVEKVFQNIINKDKEDVKRRRTLNLCENIDFDEIFGMKQEVGENNVSEIFNKSCLDVIPHANNSEKKDNSSIITPYSTTKDTSLVESFAKLTKVKSDVSNNGNEMYKIKSIKSESISRESSTKSECTSDSLKDELECTCLKKVVIYYATRTHRQIAQVVKEFKRLPYGHDKSVRHTILSSRENCCVNNEVKYSSENITTTCININSTAKKESFKTNGCSFKENIVKIFKGKCGNLRNDLIENDTPVWDLEEIVDYGEARGFCPYFATFSCLRNDANLVFCPFPYLIDPAIRKCSQIFLSNDIVILDEAHNIEDFCRDSSSFEFSEKELIHSLNDLYNKHQQILSFSNVTCFNIQDSSDALAKLNVYKSNLKVLYEFLKMVLQWFRSFANEVLNVPTKDKVRSKVFTTHFIYQTTELFRLDGYLKSSEILKELEKVFNGLSNDKDEFIDDKETKEGLKLITEDLEVFKPCRLTLNCIGKFINFCYFFNFNPSAYRLNYSITETSSDFNIFSFDYQQNSMIHDSDVLYSNEHQYMNNVGLSQHPVMGHFIAGEPYTVIKENCVVKMNLWCMDPSICFKDAFKDTLSVVLASGTLSPIKTFASELGTQFTQIGQGRQIIPKEQIFTCIIPKGPHGIELTCSSSCLKKSDQGGGVTVIEELAYLIFDICQTVEKGILVFVPNYNLIDLICNAMMNLGLMKDLKKVKTVLKEPKRGGELDRVINEYKHAIKNHHKISSTCTGAVMFAVFRGKISEGIDFPDDLARCVISIGIPYPSLGQPQISEKIKYNETFYKNENLLNGSEWYKSQAYRALNQALGRCLRHRNDWGIILLVDYRFIEQVYKNDDSMISNWVKENLRKIDNFPSLINQIKMFTKERCRS